MARVVEPQHTKRASLAKWRRLALAMAAVRVGKLLAQHANRRVTCAYPEDVAFRRDDARQFGGSRIRMLLRIVCPDPAVRRRIGERVSHTARRQCSRVTRRAPRSAVAFPAGWLGERLREWLPEWLPDTRLRRIPDFDIAFACRYCRRNHQQHCTRAYQSKPVAFPPVAGFPTQGSLSSCRCGAYHCTSIQVFSQERPPIRLATRCAASP